jgi:hypothetical protein
MSDDVRTYLSLRVDDLEKLFAEACGTQNVSLLEELEIELSHRSTKRALALLQRLEEYQDALADQLPKNDKLARIKDSMFLKPFGGTLRAWRVYAKRIAAQPELRDEILSLWDCIYEVWYENTTPYFVFSQDEMQFMEIDDSPLAGVLSHFGYRTKVETKTRRAILNELFFAEIPPIVNHYDWGEPQSNDRYNKICSTLAGLAFPHRNQRNFEAAVKVWDSDLNWFVNERTGDR